MKWMYAVVAFACCSTLVRGQSSTPSVRAAQNAMPIERGYLYTPGPQPAVEQYGAYVHDCSITSFAEVHVPQDSALACGALHSNSGGVLPIIWRSLPSREYQVRPGRSLLLGMVSARLKITGCDMAHYLDDHYGSSGMITCAVHQVGIREGGPGPGPLTIVETPTWATYNRVARVPHMAPADTLRGADMRGVADSITVRSTDLFDYAIVREFDHGVEIPRVYGLAKITNNSSRDVVIDTILTHEATLSFLGLPEWIMPQSGVSGTLLPAGASVVFEFRSDAIHERFGNDPAKLLAAGEKVRCDLLLRGVRATPVHFRIDLAAENCRRLVRWNQQENRYEALDPSASIETR